MAFDIVWFTAEHEEEAMLSLNLLPDEEFAARGLTHHFRRWQNCPFPNPDGTQGAGARYCVHIHRRGSVALLPGRVSDGHICLAEWCEGIQEVKPGFAGATLKPEIWLTEAVVKEAETDRVNEDRLIKARAEARQARETKRLQKIAIQLRLYLETIAEMMGVENPDKMTQPALQRLAIMARAKGIQTCTVEEWIRETCPAREADPEPTPYDPLTFMAHCDDMLSALETDRHEFVTNPERREKDGVVVKGQYVPGDDSFRGFQGQSVQDEQSNGEDQSE